MSALTLDARFPVIVIAGDFNAAIFQTSWVAANLHGLGEGQDVEAVELVAEAPSGVFQVTFIERVALLVSANRIEAFVLDHEAATLKTLEKVLGNLLTVLPHTPVRAIGCNFHWTDNDPSADVLAYFDTPEGLEAEYRLLSNQLSVQIELEDAVLNFARVLAGGSVRINFNYHRAFERLDECQAALQDLVTIKRAHSLDLLRKLYKYDEHETVTFASHMGREADDNEAAIPNPIAENADGQN